MEFLSYFRTGRTMKITKIKVSVSSRSYILSYVKLVKKSLTILMINKFPSPLGVIFSLIKDVKDLWYSNYSKFPSPLGVIFSLILIFQFYLVQKSFVFPSPLGVIFSLILFQKVFQIIQIITFPSPLGVIFSLMN